MPTHTMYVYTCSVLSTGFPHPVSLCKGSADTTICSRRQVAHTPTPVMESMLHATTVYVSDGHNFPAISFCACVIPRYEVRTCTDSTGMYYSVVLEVMYTINSETEKNKQHHTKHILSQL